MKKLFLILIFIPTILIGQTKAFPSAIGAGAYITGGRGGTVYHVTNLNSSGTGSFADAVSQSNRIIVFDVSGVIETGSIQSNSSNITIAGQTAPAGGITFAGGRFSILEESNWIIRYVRFRGGWQDTNDSFDGINTTQVYLDHCSFSFGADEAASVRENTVTFADIGESTIAYNLFAESKTGGILKGTQGYTYAFNATYNIPHRFPNFAINGTGSFDIINNLTWNYQNRLVRGNDEANVLHIGNYADLGNTPMRDDRINQYQYTGVVPTIFTSGNKIVAVNSQAPYTYTVAQMNADNKLMWSFFDSTQSPYTEDDRLPTAWFTDTQRVQLGQSFPIYTADQAKDSILADVGANKSLNSDGTWSWNIDSYDQSYIDNMTNGVYESGLSIGEYFLVSHSGTTRPVGYDTDGDGIPNDYEIAQGWNPNVANDDVVDASGYTQIELFINEVDEEPTPIPVTGIEWENDTQTVEVGGFLDLTLNWSPSNATDKGFSLLSSNTSVVSNAGAVIGEGTATLTITADDTTNGTISDVMNVMINAAPEPSGDVRKGKFFVIDY